MVRIFNKSRKEPKKLNDFFGYTVGDIYISDWMAGVAASNQEVEKSLLQGLYDFFHHNYGDISKYDKDLNLEADCFGGDLFGRYHSGDWKLPANINGEILRIRRPDLIFKIRTYEGNTYILADIEPDWLIREEEKTD